MGKRFERGERHWAEIAEWVKALGYVESFDKSAMRGDLAERMKRAVEAGAVTKLRRGVYQLVERP
jgi:hypothetical protein